MNVFICYRREETASTAEVIHLRLSSQIGDNRVFLDTSTLTPGDKFSSETVQRISDSSVFLLLIGPDWEENVSTRMEQNQDDFVRKEVLEAQKLDIPIIPIWVDRSGHALELSKLPADLKFISEINASDLRTTHTRSDFDEIARSLSVEFPQIFGSSRAPHILSEELARSLLRIPVFFRRSHPCLY